MNLLTKQQIETLLDGTTPGPWTVRGPTSQDGFMIYDVGMYGVGEAWNINGSPENEANAKIMAAAPDLARTVIALHADRDRLAAANAALEAQVGALRLQLDQKDALYDSGFQAGVKLGWNLGVSGDEAGFQAATSSTEHVAELKRIRAALASAAGGAK